MKKNETSSTIPNLIVLPQAEWDSIRNDIALLKEAYEKTSRPSLGDWLSELETQSLLGRKGTTLWRLRANGVILSKKIGSRNYYDKQSIINFLNSDNK